MDTAVTALLLIVIVLGLGFGMYYMAAERAKSQQVFADAHAAETFMSSLAGTSRDLVFTDRFSANIRYDFQLGRLALAQDGVTSIQGTINSNPVAIATANHALLEYVGSYAAFGGTPYYLQGIMDNAVTSSVTDAFVIYAYSRSPYSYVALNNRVYVSNVTSQPGLLIVQFTVTVFQAGFQQTPSKGVLVATKTVGVSTSTFNISVDGLAIFNVQSGGKKNSVAFPVAAGSTLQVVARTVNVQWSYANPQ